jgi:enoyl-CoA hydratase/carnithine racemase
VPDVRVERQGAVMIVHFARPERHNALGGTLTRDLLMAFDEANRDDSVRVVVTTGDGDAYCVGADRAELQALGGEPGAPHDHLNDGVIGGERGLPVLSPEQRRLETLGIGRWILRMWELEKPTIAAMNGAAAGGGLAIALMHDFRIGAATAKYGAAYIHIGVSPELGMSLLLTRLVGYRVATDLLLRGRVITGEEAAAVGLVDRAVDSSQVLEAATELAYELA